MGKVKEGQDVRQPLNKGTVGNTVERKSSKKQEKLVETRIRRAKSSEKKMQLGS